MKSIYTFVLFIALSQFSFSQLSDEEEAEILWETNIQAILDLDKAKVIEQTNFPLSTVDGDWDKSKFESSFELVFNEELLKDLKYQSIRDIQPVEDETRELSFMLVILTFSEIDGEESESATILSFKKYDGVWKLYQIDMAG